MTNPTRYYDKDGNLLDTIEQVREYTREAYETTVPLAPKMFKVSLPDYAKILGTTLEKLGEYTCEIDFTVTGVVNGSRYCITASNEYFTKEQLDNENRLQELADLGQEMQPEYYYSPNKVHCKQDVLTYKLECCEGKYAEDHHEHFYVFPEVFQELTGIPVDKQLQNEVHTTAYRGKWLYSLHRLDPLLGVIAEEPVLSDPWDDASMTPEEFWDNLKETVNRLKQIPKPKNHYVTQERYNQLRRYFPPAKDIHNTLLPRDLQKRLGFTKLYGANLDDVVVDDQYFRGLKFGTGRE